MKARLVLALVVSAGMLAPSMFSVAGGFAEVPKGGPKQAGPGGPGGGRARMEEMRAALYKKLHLSAAQIKKIDAYEAHSRRAREAAMKEHKGDRAAMRPMMQKMRDEHERFMKKTLTTSQFTKYQAEMKAMRAKFGGGRGRGGPGGPGGPRPGGPGGPPPAK